MGIGGALQGGKAQSALFAFALFSLFFVFIGFGLISIYFYVYARAKKTHYAVTNRRIMIVIAGKTKTVQQHELSRLSNLRRQVHGDRGDLSWTVQSSMQGLRSRIVNPASSPVGSNIDFIGIERPSDVERIVEEQSEKIAQSRINPHGDSNVHY
jgi:hypothetical protein